MVILRAGSLNERTGERMKSARRCRLDMFGISNVIFNVSQTLQKNLWKHSFLKSQPSKQTSAQGQQ